ncbi:hypothetical protein APR50_06265 [Variovorax paradoxus]|nr:hypothetical protein APR52_18730 [Variovorax paradoxus]KPV10341.1 hypothetical protein APR50_06265 [Variovorax paradoxus]KPV12817.1 hypothetical protein APR49_05610 [Variovorax paradoxus]KPV24044.1 hypothetical protein APR51_05085 [Variovorax paradoxus]KPV35159.1 hypothetical protein APR48_04825 [Variovorax paradoxus]
MPDVLAELADLSDRLAASQARQRRRTRAEPALEVEKVGGIDRGGQDVENHLIRTGFIWFWHIDQRHEVGIRAESQDMYSFHPPLHRVQA